MLCLYGYSNQQRDGLSFPDDVTDPDVGRVAAVTLEVMSLRMELEMLIKVCVFVCYLLSAAVVGAFLKMVCLLQHSSYCVKLSQVSCRAKGISNFVNTLY